MTVPAQLIPLPDAAATRRLGFVLGRSLPSGHVLLLEGELGSGKTTLVQGIGQGLGITDPIVSPTFTLVNEYLEGRIPLYHFDLYRLQPSEVDALHVETYWDSGETPPGIVAIEWADRLQHRPPDYLYICLIYGMEGDREAHLLPVGNIQMDLDHLATLG
jgi:tRNA threonylcarbamoyladenosine biosynthesis protein TsaE